MPQCALLASLGVGAESAATKPSGEDIPASGSRADAPRGGAGFPSSGILDSRGGGGEDYGLDLEFHRRCLPVARFLFESYWRVKVSGLANVPAKGGAILIGNHSGALPFDAAMASYALSELPGPGRVARPLYDRFLQGHPRVDEACRRLGGVPARYAVADELLGRGELVMIFPEGVGGVAKLFEDRYRLRRFATSAARLSCEHRVPIVPFTVIGAEEMYPMIGRSGAAGAAVGVPHVPVTPLFPLLGPLGMVPLPTKWTISFGRRIYLYRESRFRGEHGNDFDAMAARLRRTVQLQLRRDLGRRASIFLG